MIDCIIPGWPCPVIQPSPQEPVRWEEFRLQGSDPLAVRAGKRLRNQEFLVTSLGGTRLRLELNRVPLWRGDHVEVRQLGDDFARYVYLPRLKSPAVLAAAVSDGVGQLTWQKDGFAYAEDYDVATGRYRGLRAGAQVRVTEDDPGLVVKPDVAQRQLAAEVPAAPPARAADGKVQTGAGEPPEKEKKPRRPKRFHGTVVLDSTRAGRDASRVAEEVVAHLAGLPGAEVTVTLEIEALIPDGAPENVVRTVTENAAALKFASHGFEEE